MAKIRFAEGLHVVPLLAPAIATSDTESQHVKLENMQWLSFLVQWGALENSTDSFTITVKSTTNGAGSTASGDTAIPFWYRLSEAVGGDNWGDATYVSTGSDGVSITGALDNKMLILDVDPAIIPSKDADASHMYVDIDWIIGGTDINYGPDVIGVFESRYPQVEHISSTSTTDLND